MQKWEYKTTAINATVDFRPFLNPLGAVGWEVVSVIPAPEVLRVLVFLRRPLPAEPAGDPIGAEEALDAWAHGYTPEAWRQKRELEAHLRDWAGQKLAEMQAAPEGEE